MKVIPVLKEEEIKLDIDSTEVQTKPVGNQNPSEEVTPNQPIKAEGNEKTPDSSISNEIKDKDPGDTSIIAKGQQDAPTAATAEVKSDPKAETAESTLKEDEIATVITPVKDEPEFVIYDGEPRAVINDLGEEIEVLYDALSGETKIIKKEMIGESYKNKKIKEGQIDMRKKKVYEVKEEVKVGNVILEKGDRFIVVEAEEAEKEEPKNDEEPAKTKVDDKKEESITFKGRKYRLVKEAEGDEKDKAEDEKLAKEAGMTPEEWEKSEADKEHDKKEESRKIYTVKEEIKIGNVILEKGDRFMIVEDNQKPDPDAKEYLDPVNFKLNMPDVRESKKDDEKMAKLRAMKKEEVEPKENEKDKDAAAMAEAEEEKTSDKETSKEEPKEESKKKK